MANIIRGTADLLFIHGDQEVSIPAVEVLLTETMPGTFELNFGSRYSSQTDGADRVWVEMRDRCFAGPISWLRGGVAIFRDEDAR